MAGAKLRISKFSDPWKSYTINEIFDRVGNPVELEEGAEYQEIGIRSHGKGLFYKDKTTAAEIGNKRVFWIEPDCFIVNIVFAWERAVARTTQAEVGMIASHRFPMYKPKKNLVDLDYITQFFTTKRGQNLLILASPGGAGRNKTLGQKEFGETRVKLPSVQEQKEIADILKEVDCVINLVERDVILWEEKQQGVMQKIFSQEVRFKDKNGEEYPEWTDCTFADVFTILGNNTYSRAELNYESGEVQNVHYGDILTKFGAFIDCKKEPLPLISDESNANRAMKYPLISGDVVIADTAEDETVGKVTEIIHADGLKIVSGLHTIPCRPKSNMFAEKYLGYYMNSYAYHSQLFPLIQGTKVSSISKSAIQDTMIKIPCVDEQRKIAECLASMDDVINIKKLKLETWKTIKKGLLQQMFV